MLLVVVPIAVALLGMGYVFYGPFVARRLGVGEGGETPAHGLEDGLDYVPTRPWVLFGHHFSSIAGAGPIVGPVIASVAFGWLPALIWIVVGAVLIGGVQDFTSLIVSIRHRARSVAEVAREQISPLANTLFLVFVWFALVYVIVVFVDLTSATFVGNPGVASSSILYIALALVFGVLITGFGLGLGTGSLVFVPLVFLGIWLGQQMPLALPVDAPGQLWSVVLLGYCLVASVLPVWLLLQPRDYLASYLLFACLGGGLLGIVAMGGALPEGVDPLPAVVALKDANLGFLFPALFVTIACGAVSGFHSIVASGTTAKQLDREAHAKPVAYGGMILEGVLAVIAVSTVIVVGLGPARGLPPTLVFAQGLGHVVSRIGFPAALGTSFGALAISTFLLTTLDTCTRLARYVLEELFRLRKSRFAATLATAASLALPLILTQVTLRLPDGTPAPAWKVIWPVFGATNQLLGALALLVVTAWLRNQGRRYLFAALPMLFMFIVTLTALAQLVWRYGLGTFVGSVSLVLALLALVILGEAARLILRTPPGGRSQEESPVAVS